MTSRTKMPTAPSHKGVGYTENLAAAHGNRQAHHTSMDWALHVKTDREHAQWNRLIDGPPSRNGTHTTPGKPTRKQRRGERTATHSTRRLGKFGAGNYVQNRTLHIPTRMRNATRSARFKYGTHEQQQDRTRPRHKAAAMANPPA